MLRSLTFLTLLLWAGSVIAQEPATFEVPRTAYGHPDFQGLWKTGFSTMMERPEGVETLVVPEEAASRISGVIHSNFNTGVKDPEFSWNDPLPLTRVRGEYRTSIITYPENGKIPFSENGSSVSAEQGRLILMGLDGPEQRPLEERCLASMVYPPMRPLPLELPITIVQNEGHMVMFMEDAAGYRLIRISDVQGGVEDRRFQGYSVGHWESDTLVVTTTHFRGEYPGRLNVPQPILVGDDTVITERFTRVAEDELNYQFTVDDPEYYTETWSGEFSLQPMPGISYEYGCHEGNYSLPGILSGGRVSDIEKL